MRSVALLALSEEAGGYTALPFHALLKNWREGEKRAFT